MTLADLIAHPDSLPRLRQLYQERKSGAVARRVSPLQFVAYRDDPVAFAREVLGVEPWERQIAIMEALAREPRVTVRSCNGAGKTLCAGWLVLWWCATRPGAIAITTAPTGYQVKNLLWRRVREAFAASRTPLPGRCQTQQWDLGPNWYALGMATDEEIHFQGPHSSAGVLLIGDEASGLKPWMFAAMAGSLTEPGAKQLLIGNPNDPNGAFYESHKSWPSKQKFHISAFDVPAHVLRPSWKEEVLADFGADSAIYQVRVLGDFPDQAEGALFPLSLLEAAQKRNLEAAAHEPVTIGVDIAYTGPDESVAYVRRGSQVIAAEYWRGFDTLRSAGKVTPLARQYGARQINIDVIGYGAGCKDQLKENFAPAPLQDLQQWEATTTLVHGINVGEAARDKERFFNRRSELYWGLRQRFVDGDIQIPATDNLLVDQLLTLRFTYTPRGQIKVLSKDDIRKDRPANAKWHSPDRADALCLCYAHSGMRWEPAAASGSVPIKIAEV